MTASDGTLDGKGDLKLSVVEWDSTNETFKTTPADGTNTVIVYNGFSGEFIGDGTNDIKMFYQAGQGGCFWITAVEC